HSAFLCAAFSPLSNLNAVTQLSGHMRRYRRPLSVPARADIGIAAVPLFAVCRGAAGACVDDRDISEAAQLDFLRRKATDRHRSSLCARNCFLSMSARRGANTR